MNFQLKGRFTLVIESWESHAYVVCLGRKRIQVVSYLHPFLHGPIGFSSPPSQVQLSFSFVVYSPGTADLRCTTLALSSARKERIVIKIIQLSSEWGALAFSCIYRKF